MLHTISDWSSISSALRRSWRWCCSSAARARRRARASAPGASGTVFGARGASTALSRATAILAAIFMVTSLSLAYVGARKAARRPAACSISWRTPSAPANTRHDAVPGGAARADGRRQPAGARRSSAPAHAGAPAAPGSAPARVRRRRAEVSSACDAYREQ